MRAVILAAGFGTRLWPLTEDRTKPAIPFLNRPLISYSVEYLVSHSITDIIINLHHQPDSIRRALEDGSRFGARIQYSLEEQILGTSGALDKVRDRLLDYDFVVMNGKVVTDIDLGLAIRVHREREAIATLVLQPNPARQQFSIVETDDRGRITKFGRLPAPVSAVSGERGGETGDAPLMFTGIQVLSPRILEYVPRGRFSHSTIDVYPRAIEAGELVLGHIAPGDWYELSTLDRYLAASLALMGKRGQRIVMGAGCTLADGAQVEESVLWERVTVGSGARVRQSVLADRVRIPPGVSIEGSVVVRRDTVNDLERGEIVGENVVVPIG
jgi:mannose-1-phosphate guanylyltransferase/phosphomannomutase